MDVNLTISLMRGQMGAVIEKAVNVAVETVLGEMIRVVGLKFEEIKREMNTKEKENENIRRMLETSRSQMKTMRKYITVLTAKDQNRLYHGDMTQSVGVHTQRGPTSTVSMCTKASNPCIRPRVTEPAPVAGPSWVRQHMHVSKPQNIQEPMRSENHIGDIHIEEIHGSSAHKAVDHSSHQLVDSQGLLSETSDPIWGQNPLTSADTEHTDMPDTGMLSTSMMTDDPSQTAVRMNFGAPSLKIKKEEPEVEIVCVKDEPSEAASSSRFEYPNHELQQQVGEPDLGVPLDLPGSFQALQSPSTSAELTIPAFVGLDPSTYDDSQLSVAGVQKQVRPRRKDLNLYDEFKRTRTQLRGRNANRGRNTNRRREVEQTLPQALLADLVRERREKTRLRVARWRAKRKLQACLMASQAAQFNGGPAQGTPAQHAGLIPVRKRGGMTGQRGGLAFRRGISETGTYNLLLQLGPSSSQSHGINEDPIQPGSQHRTSGSMYQ